MNLKSKKQFLIISISLHVIVILMLIFFSWPTQKEEVVDAIQMVNMEAPAAAPAQPAAPPKQEPITPITAPKKDEILIPEKKQPPKPIEKPKPAPKVQSKLKDRLKDLMKEEEKTKKETPPETEDVKKNSQQSLEFKDPNPEQAPSSSTNTPG